MVADILTPDLRYGPSKANYLQNVALKYAMKRGSVTQYDARGTRGAQI